MGKVRILVVDDQKMTMTVVSSVLKKHGYEVQTAFNGVEALEKVNESIPDLIVLDIMLPLINGYEVCHLLKSNVKTAQIPILMLTAKERVDGQKVKKGWQAAEKIKDCLQGYDVGATEFLTKSVKAGELVKRIKFILWSGGL